MMKKKKPKFAEGYHIYKIIWIFVIGSIFGCFYETLLHFAKHGYFESRSGLIYGPFNPVYGFGAVIFMLTITRIKNLKLVFLASTFAGGAFEYLCSWFQELAYGTVSWDYSHYFMNFGGRTSLFHAVCWGLLGVIFVKWIYPCCSSIVESLSKRTGTILTWGITIFLLFDMGISSIAASRQEERRKSIPPKNGFEELIDHIYPDSFMEKIYPNSMIKQ